MQTYDGPTVLDGFASPSDVITYVDLDAIDQLDGLPYGDPILFEDRPSRAKYVLKAGDILIGTVRPNRGIVAMMTGRTNGWIASSGFTLARPTAGQSPAPEFIYAFLRSLPGRLQLVRRVRGSMYPAVLNSDVFEVLIPSPDESDEGRIANLVSEGLKTQDAFFELLGEQHRTLDAFLGGFGSPPSPLETTRAGADHTIVNLDAMFDPEGPQRIDAEFYRGEYQSWVANLEQHVETVKLGDVVQGSAGRGRSPGLDQVPTVKQAALSNVGINWSAVALESGDCRKTGIAIRMDDVLLASTAHEIYYVGRKVDVVREIPEEFSECLGLVADVMRLRPIAGASLPSSYIAAFLRHPAGLYQVQRCIRGLRGGHTYPKDLRKFVVVPVPDTAWLEAFEALSKSLESTRIKAARKIQMAVEEVNSLYPV